jgi:hypothetical protein
MVSDPEGLTPPLQGLSDPSVEVAHYDGHDCQLPARICALVLGLTFQDEGAMPMPLSPRESKYVHYMSYLPPLMRMALGVFCMGLPFVVNGAKEFELTVIIVLLGLGFFGFGAYQLWRHSRHDPTAPAYTIEDLPPDQRARTLRRMTWIVPIAFTPATALVGYELARLEYGWADRVSVWAPVAFVYNTFGFWPAVLLIPGAGLLLVLFLATKLRSIRESNPTIS